MERGINIVVFRDIYDIFIEDSIQMEIQFTIQTLLNHTNNALIIQTTENINRLKCISTLDVENTKSVLNNEFTLQISNFSNNCSVSTLYF